MVTLTLAQARRFLLEKNGLGGTHRFSGKQGALDYVRQAGCIQFDPIDACGRTADLSLNSRVKGYKKGMLHELLYEDRALVDYFDKNLAIMPVGDWPYFARTRAQYAAQSRSREQVEPVAHLVLSEIAARGPLCSRDLKMDEKIDWDWSVDTRLARVALETLYFRGDLVVHHKSGTTKYYALAQGVLPSDVLAAPDPLPDDNEHLKWRTLRRIGAVGMLWNRPSDAWLCLEFRAEARARVFAELEAEGRILKFAVEGIRQPLYCLSGDEPLLREVLQPPQPRSRSPRTEFLAPLDCMMWDRNLIRTLFGFHYRWEIYTPVAERKHGYYVLPILHGEQMVGRIEAVCQRKQGVLLVKNVWLEEGVARTKTLERGVERAIDRLRIFNEMEETTWEEAAWR